MNPHATVRPMHQPFVPIARFANVAEAGYFHSELEGHLDCEVRLTTQNHFDAPSASWWSNYVLTVPESVGDEATELLKLLVADSDPGEFRAGDSAPVVPAKQGEIELSVPESRIHWMPIVLTLTAGTFVIWATKQVNRHAREPAKRAANQVDIWEQLSQDGRPWIQNFDNGRGRRELMIDRDSQMATLREDHDGDGIFERKSRIFLSPAAE